MIGRRLVALAPVVAALAVAGCGGGSNDNGSSSSDSSTSSSSGYGGSYGSSSGSGSGGGGAQAKVSEKEFSISNPGTVKAGKVTFTSSNVGTVDHALTVDGPGVADKTSGTIAAGSKGKVTVTLKKGTYTIYCPIDGHKGLGMKRTVVVQ